MGLWGVWKVGLKGALVPAAMQSPPATQQEKPTPLMPPFLKNMKTYPYEIFTQARQDVEQPATKTGAKTIG